MTNEELLRYIIAKHFSRYRPSPQQARYSELLDSGFSEAYRAAYGEYPHEKHKGDWKSYAKELRQQGKSLEEIARYIRLIYGRSCASEIARLFNESARDKQREYQATYRKKHREEIRERDRKFYRRNRERILAARRERRRNKPPRTQAD